MAIPRLRPLLLVAVLLLRAFASLPTQAAARGGLDPSPGIADRKHGSSSRSLLQDQPEITEEMVRGYMSNFELESAIQDFGRRCANISRTYSIGKSVNGSPLWAIEISDKPGQREAEPAFKFIGNVHGDEPVGREVLMQLAYWLCDNYLKDPLAALIVENTHLHILPSMNPDGFALRRRGNANNVDLNRDFPDQFFPNNDDIKHRQPETRAIMNWIKQEHFTASASLHGGALVANYPWDGSRDTRKQYYGCPDDKTFRYMASLYSQSHYNMSLSKEFEGGITNGALWYPIYGGMQDWNYIHGGCFELTLEISDVKWPKASELLVIWKQNKMSMLNLVASLVKTGVHGRIFAADTGRPIPGSLMVKGIDSKINASGSFGDYHRILAPGQSYEVVASMEGYRPKRTRVMLGREATNLDFILDPDGAVRRTKPLRNDCGCSCNDNSNTGKPFLLREAYLWLYLLALFFLLALYLLFRRRMALRLAAHRHPPPKRPVAV
ncbi:carboxypeptidase SOL1 isoform X1 [Hordeum vulgare subsp. vulgare]|uniref:Peptidase M14 domain-containing protein n=2 Tax=Hordeum vulgare subsp. vulgare TaxID=112509 RepID=A0A8I7BI79_HORVV|nr:carboxypeptidase SOL1 isoform X1 [Hordeum vulgare subsp. vulgare]